MVIAGLLLAAGKSLRFGANKLVSGQYQDSPLGLASWYRLHGALPDSSFVIVNPLIPASVNLFSPVTEHLIYCESRGLGDSIAYGVSQTAFADAWLIALADMPDIQPQVYCGIIAALEAGHSLVAPNYHGRRGHPAGFSKLWYHELCTLQGDVGAKTILTKNEAQLFLYETTDSGVVFDVDQPHGLKDTLKTP